MIRSNVEIIKSKTNDNKPCTQRFILAKAKGMSTGLLVSKTILSKINDDELINEGYKCVKTFKDVALYKQGFAIKLDTLGQALKQLGVLKPSK
jgi:hypothetical protein